MSRAVAVSVPAHGVVDLVDVLGLPDENFSLRLQQQGTSPGTLRIVKDLSSTEGFELRAETYTATQFRVDAAAGRYIYNPHPSLAFTIGVLAEDLPTGGASGPLSATFVYA